MMIDISNLVHRRNLSKVAAAALLFIVGSNIISNPKNGNLKHFLRNLDTIDNNPNHNDLIGRPLTYHRSLATPITEESLPADTRELLLKVDSLNEYYVEEGNGECLDVDNSVYDYATYSEVMSIVNCADKCAERVLLEEHRGFIYDTAGNFCHCLYDDGKIPFPLLQKANSQIGGLDSFNANHTGSGAVISTSDPTNSDHICYSKKPNPMGSNILTEYYSEVGCSSSSNPALDGESDSVIFNDVTNVFNCGKICMRYNLMLTHIGFGYKSSTNTCECFFDGDESPRPNKIAGAGASRITKQKFNAVAARHDNILTCYTKNPLEQPKLADHPHVNSDSLKIFINEFHYRNEGDDEPFIEIAGPYDATADGYHIILYQGRNGKMRYPYSLMNKKFIEGTEEMKNLGWGFITITDIDSKFIRNGKEVGDGIALTKGSGTECLQFISYAHNGYGTEFTAQDGPCEGFTSTNVGVSEPRLTDENHSLQLKGTGNTYGSFTWEGPKANTKGDVNSPGQTLTAY